MKKISPTVRRLLIMVCLIGIFTAMAFLSCSKSSTPEPTTCNLTCSASSDSTDGPLPLTVHFQSEGKGNCTPFSYRWEFGDGGVSDQRNPTHQYVSDTSATFTATLTVSDAKDNTCQKQFVIHAEHTGDALECFPVLASATPDSGATPLSVLFNNGAQGGFQPMIYVWSFGDGAGSTDPNPSHIYANTGRFTASYLVADANHDTCRGTILVTVVCPTLTCNATVNLASGCAPLTAQFTGSSASGCANHTYNWAFGDGSTSAEQSPSHIYQGAGNYSATLTVTDSAQNTCSKTVAISVTGGALSCQALASADSGCAPLAVEFSGSDSGGCPPMTYSWAFGDGGTSNEQNPSHSFQNAGSFTATMTVTDSKNATCEKTVTVKATGGSPLTCSITGDTAGSCIPFEACLTGSAAGGCQPYRYHWSFSDGGVSDTQRTCRTYQTVGNYTATLTVTDAKDMTCQRTVPIVVTSSGTLNCTVSPSSDSGCAPLAVRFSGSGSGGCPPLTYAWAFGDAGTSSEQNPIHSYQSAGNYIATLTTTDSKNVICKDTATIRVTGGTPVTCTASANSTEGCAPLAVQFTGTGTGGCAPLKYSWAFGDGGTSNEQSPSYSYQNVGNYTAVLTVTDAKSVAASKSMTITVTGGPLSCSAAGTPAEGCAPLPVQFVATASGGCPPLTYKWVFGDGEMSEEQSPTHTYQNPNTYTATLTVTDAKNVKCSREVTTMVIGGVPTCSVSANPTSPCVSRTVEFKVSTEGGCEPLSYNWIFGDGEASGEQNPTHAYDSIGSYDAKVIVTDAKNLTCQKSVAVSVTGGTLLCSAEGSLSNACAPVPVQFRSSASGGCPPLTYHWAFDDGNTSEEQSPNHTYENPGVYSAALTVTDAKGVSCNQTVSTTVSGGPLNCLVTADPSSPCVNRTVQFSSSGGGGCEPLTYAWTFGDDATSTEQNPRHSYGVVGPYQARVVITDAKNFMCDRAMKITVLPDTLAVPWQITPSHYATGLDTSVNLTWTAVTDPCGEPVTYTVYDCPEGCYAIASGLQTNSYSWNSLNYNSTYYWKIRASVSTKKYMDSPIWNFSTRCPDLPAPSNPTPINGAISQSRTPLLKWDAVIDPCGGSVTYDLYGGVSPFNMILVAERLTTTQFRSPQLPARYTFYWRVVVRGMDSRSTTGPTWHFATGL
jgi:PKD repeat protein